MRNQNGNGHGNADRVRATRPLDLIDDTPPPVFVLSVARSGSTLLRFILDSHPELACPPETNVGQVCAGLARLWDLLDPSPESVKDGWKPVGAPDHLPDDAAAAIRTLVNGIYGRYLARHGKRRWCDKSLDSAQMADLLARVYPGAQFICLYRHCMDMIVSAIDAAPWGLSGYGFDPYVAGTPGNAVLAAARCWLDQTRKIVEFQERHPNRCHGVRYEDLVTAPEQIAADLFAFLDLAPVPGITETCLSQEHDTRGAADHKIWFTSRISTDSLGQGAKIPLQTLPPEFLKNLNETLDQLGYRQVDEHWKAALGPIDPRADGTPRVTPDEPADATLDAAAGEIASRLGVITEDRLRALASRWPATAGRNLVITVQPSNGTQLGHCWTVSCADSTLTVCQGESRSDAMTKFLASPATWQALLDGQANFAAEVRAGGLRVLDMSAGPGANDTVNLTAEMHLIAHLLGLTGSSQSPNENSPANVPLSAGRKR